MKQYNIVNMGNRHFENVDWNKIEELTIDNYPWYEDGLKQKTFVKVIILNDNIILKVKCEDVHSYSCETKLNGDVYKDSCFEFFLTPEDNKGGAYFNIEINCCGVMHLGYRNNQNSKLCPSDIANEISIVSSIKTLVKEETKNDNYWELIINIPISALEQLSNKKIIKDTWYGNFYRCGGLTDPQYATWNNVEWEYPNYHLPKQFGLLKVINK